MKVITTLIFLFIFNCTFAQSNFLSQLGGDLLNEIANGIDENQKLLAEIESSKTEISKLLLKKNYHEAQNQLLGFQQLLASYRGRDKAELTAWHNKVSKDCELKINEAKIKYLNEQKIKQQNAKRLQYQEITTLQNNAHELAKSKKFNECLVVLSRLDSALNNSSLKDTSKLLDWSKKLRAYCESKTSNERSMSSLEMQRRIKELEDLIEEKNKEIADLKEKLNQQNLHEVEKANAPSASIPKDSDASELPPNDPEFDKEINEAFENADQSLYLGRMFISDFSPLLKLKNDLKFLRIEHCTVRDISVIAELENLTEIGIRYNKNLTDFSPLSALTKLKKIVIDTEQPNFDPTFLINLENLEEVYITAGLKDFNFIRNMRKLKRLNLGGNEISDLSPLRHFRSHYLMDLDLSDNQIEDISKIAEYTKELGFSVSSLNFRKNQIKDISPLAGLEISTLDIGENLIEDYMPLKEIDFGSFGGGVGLCKKIPGDQFRILKEAMPKVMLQRY